MGGVLEIRVLGPLEVLVGGAPVAVTGARRRAVLARLAAAPSGVDVDRLVTDVWPSDPPGSAVANVHTYMSQLRRLVGRDRVLSTPSGYRLDEEVQVDADLFEAECTAATTVGDPLERERRLRMALERWRGEAYEGFEDLQWASAVAARLTALRMASLDRRFGAALDAAGHREVIADLEAAVLSHPLDERFWAHLIVALYRDGRQTEALRTYERLRRTLADEVGLEPSPALAQLERAVLAHDPALDPPLSTVAPSPPPHVEFPAILAQRRTLALVGRDAESAMVASAWEQTSAVRGRTPPPVVMLTGEPGVGKTRLAAEIAWRMHRAGTAVGAGRCDDLLVVPYGPVLDAVQSAGGPPPPALETTNAGPRTPDVARSLLFDQVTTDLDALLARSPVLLVIDDLQWIDAATALLLRHIAGDHGLKGCLILATCRDTDLDDGSAAARLVDDLDIAGRVQRVTLHGLDPMALERLLAATGTTDTAVAAAVARSTAGNPFLALELASELQQPRGGDRPGVPAAVAALTTQRLGRLGPTATSVLTAASLLGEVFDSAPLAAVKGLGGPAVVAPALDAAARARLVTEVTAGHYRFAHALLHDAIKARLPSAGRAELHSRIANALEAVIDPTDRYATRLAHHWAAAASLGFGTRAATSAINAAAGAAQQGAPEQALAMLIRARAAIDADPTVQPATCAALNLGLAEAHDALGQVDASRAAAWEAANQARQCGDVRLLARAASCFGRRQQVGFLEDRVVPLLEEAIAAVTGSDTVLEATVTAALAAYWPFAGDRTRGDHLATRATKLARAAVSARTVGAASALAESLSATLYAHQGGSDPVQVLPIANELVELAEAGEPTVARGLHLRGQLRLATGDRPGFEQDLAALDALGRRVSVTDGAAQVAQRRALLALLDGNFGDAERHADEALALAPDTLNVVLTHEGQRLWRQLELGENEAAIARYTELIDALPTLTVLEACRTLAEARSGSDHARARLCELAGDAVDREAAVLQTLVLAALSETAAIVADTGIAKLLQPRLAPYEGLMLIMGEGICCFGAADRLLAQLHATTGDADIAERYYRSALQLERRIGSPPLAARTQLWHARLLIDIGRASEAEPLLADAATTATRLAMTSLERDAKQLIEHLGSTTSRQ